MQSKDAKTSEAAQSIRHFQGHKNLGPGHVAQTTEEAMRHMKSGPTVPRPPLWQNNEKKGELPVKDTPFNPTAIVTELETASLNKL